MNMHVTLLMSWALLTSTSTVPAAVRYVDAGNLNPTPPYTNWATAARVIQDAVDAAVAGDEIVVTNGLYATGGRAVGTNLLVNRVAVDKPLTLRSVNGPQFTGIQGYQVPATTNDDGAIRCVYLADGASLSGFTLTNGGTRGANDRTAVPYQQASGGGLWCDSTNALVTHCVLVDNSAEWEGGGAHGGTLSYCTLRGNSAGIGGGAAFSTLINSTLSGNFAVYGGGARNGTLNNCLVTGNAASGDGGGVFGEYGAVWLNNCTLTGNSAEGQTYGGGGGIVVGDWGGAYLNNCIIYSNTAPNGANYLGLHLVLSYCCTTPTPESGPGVSNMTNAPLFVDEAASNYRLRSDSPCINAGGNAYAPGPTDLDGRPRIANGTVDIGAYEFPAPAPGCWTRKTDMPMALGGHAACAVDGVLYVMGGGTKTNSQYVELASLFAYDPKTDVWTRKRDMPTARRFVAACVVDGIVYAIGGGTLLTPATGVVESYDPKTDTWFSKANLPTRRGGVAACAVDGVIYAIGGAVGTLTAGDVHPLATVEAYDPKTDQWTRRDSLPIAHAWAAAGAVNGLIYLFSDKLTYEYNPKTDRWTPKANLPAGSIRSVGSACSVVNGIIYLFGGEISPTLGGYTLSLAYDPARNKFTAMRNLPMKCEGAAAATIGNVIYQAGGASGDPMNYPGGRYYSDLCVFDPEGGIFSQILSLTRESPSTVHLVWQGEAGLRYGVQSRANVAPGGWTRLMFSSGTNAIVATSNLVQATVNVPPADMQRVFRVLEVD